MWSCPNKHLFHVARDQNYATSAKCKLHYKSAFFSLLNNCFQIQIYCRIPHTMFIIIRNPDKATMYIFPFRIICIWEMTDIFDLWSLLPQMKLREGNVFTLVCDSVHGRGCIQACNGQGDVYPSMQWAWCVDPPEQTLSGQAHPPGMAIEVSGTYPTGMHSCFRNLHVCCG